MDSDGGGGAGGGRVPPVGRPGAALRPPTVAPPGPAVGGATARECASPGRRLPQHPGPAVPPPGGAMVLRSRLVAGGGPRTPGVHADHPRDRSHVQGPLLPPHLPPRVPYHDRRLCRRRRGASPRLPLRGLPRPPLRRVLPRAPHRPRICLRRRTYLFLLQTPCPP